MNEHRKRPVIKSCLSLLCGLSFLAATVCPDLAFADPKKDVSDPVLQEILSTFGSRMPRFIDRHGRELFVADEPVTRGNLMLAIYEYDKSLKLPKRDYVSRQEFDELRAKVQQGGGTGAEKGHYASSKLDVMQVINDLQPNMPILLDNSLNSSRVFASFKGSVASKQDYEALKAKVENLATSRGNAAASGEREMEIQQIQRDMARLSKKIDELDSRPATVVSGSGSSSQEVGRLQKEVVRLSKRLEGLEDRPVQQVVSASKSDVSRSDVERINKRLASLESNIDDMEKSSGGDSARPGHTGLLTKVSIGLSMVAALFIAR